MTNSLPTNSADTGASEQPARVSKATHKQVDTLDLKVIWPTTQDEHPMIIVGEYAGYAAGKAGIFQAIEMIANKLNEVIDLVATDQEATSE